MVRKIRSPGELQALESREALSVAGTIVPPMAPRRAGFKRHAEFDFAFGLLDAQFSDCSLVLTNLLSPDEKQELAVLPVCSLVLASNSDYFKTLFAGGFKESLEKRRVEIGVKPNEVDAFKQLIHLIYTREPEDSFEESVHGYFQVAFLADRFNVRKTVELCASRLESRIYSADPAVALDFLDLEHEHIPELKRVAEASEEQFISKFMRLFSAPENPSLMELPLQGLLRILESPRLQVDSEDVLAARIMEWIKANAPAEKSLDSYVQVLWKQVRFCRLSPESMKTVVSNTLKALESSGDHDMPKVLAESMGHALKNPIGLDKGRDHAIQLATLCVTMLAQAGLMSPAEAVLFTTPQRNERRAGSWY